MARLMFGMKFSSFLAIWAMRRAAKDSGVPGALEVVEKNLHVDDYLDSRVSREYIFVYDHFPVGLKKIVIFC